MRGSQFTSFRGVKLRSGQILEADAVVLSMGPSFSGFVKRAGFLQDVPMVNEIHAHCLFDNSSLPQAIPLTFFGEVILCAGFLRV